MQTDEVVSLLQRVFGADLAGVYLYGSAVLGGLKPRSDIDVLAVVHRRSPEAERRALIGGLLEISGLYPPVGELRPLELTVVARPDVRPWRYPPMMEFQYGEWLRAGFLKGEVPKRRRNPDLAVLITSALLSGTSLVGPPADELLAPVPKDDLDRAMADCVSELLNDLDLDTCNVVLTLARMWLTFETGDMRSKDVAADWALSQLPEEHRSVLRHARSVYLGEADEDWGGQQETVRAYADTVVATIRRA